MILNNEYLAIAMHKKKLTAHEISDILGLTLLEVKKILHIELEEIKKHSETVRYRGGKYYLKH